MKEQEMSEQQATQVSIHPLLARPVIPIVTTRQNWRERFDDPTKSVEELEGLLHRGLKLNSNNELNPLGSLIDMVVFYFDVANGYSGQTATLVLQDEAERRAHCPESVYQTYPQELRKRVAKKAMEALVGDLFTDTGNNRDLPSWGWIPDQEEVMSRLILFFDPNGQGKDNLPSPYYDPLSKAKRETIFAFLERLCVQMLRQGTFSQDRLGYRLYEGHWFTIERRKEFFPKLVRILASIKKSEALLSLHLSDDEILLLKEVAMTYGAPFESPGNRFVSLDQAVHSGSGLAQVYLVIESKRREQKRLDKIREAERLAERANDQLKRLKNA